MTAAAQSRILAIIARQVGVRLDRNAAGISGECVVVRVACEHNRSHSVRCNIQLPNGTHIPSSTGAGRDIVSGLESVPCSYAICREQTDLSSKLLHQAATHTRHRPISFGQLLASARCIIVYTFPAHSTTRSGILEPDTQYTH